MNPSTAMKMPMPPKAGPSPMSKMPPPPGMKSKPPADEPDDDMGADDGCEADLENLKQSDPKVYAALSSFIKALAAEEGGEDAGGSGGDMSGYGGQ